MVCVKDRELWDLEATGRNRGGGRSRGGVSVAGRRCEWPDAAPSRVRAGALRTGAVPCL